MIEPSTGGLDWKYWLRLKGVPLAARLGRTLGLSWTELGNRLGRETLISQLPSIARSLTPADPADRPLKIVFASLMYGYTQFATFEFLLGLALEARGHDVSFVVCDRALPICEMKYAGKEQDWARLCSKCYGFGGTFLKSSGFSTRTLSELISGEDLEASGDWDSVVNEGILKHFRVGRVDSDSPVVEERENMIRESARKSAAVGKALARMRPDRVIVTHGNYSSWGPMRSMLLDAGIPVITYDHGKRKDTWNINWKYESAWWDISEEYEGIRDRPLTAEQNAVLDAYLDSRRNHSADRLQYNLGPEQEAEELRARFGLDAAKDTFVLFTNVLWDAASTDREIAFSDPVDWVVRTIRWFAGRPELQLVVRIHPAEVVVGTNQPFASIIRESVPDLPANVTLIEPDEPVNSWSVMQLASLGLVHTSTVGLEMALEGLPCAVVSRTHYRGKGFTVDVESDEDYFRLIEDWKEQDFDAGEIRDLARRYAYVLFERYQIPIPFVNEWSRGDVRSLDLASTDDLMNHESIRTIVDSIELQRSFILPDRVSS